MTAKNVMTAEPLLSFSMTLNMARDLYAEMRSIGHGIESWKQSLERTKLFPPHTTMPICSLCYNLWKMHRKLRKTAQSLNVHLQKRGTKTTLTHMGIIYKSPGQPYKHTKAHQISVSDINPVEAKLKQYRLVMFVKAFTIDDIFVNPKVIRFACCTVPFI
jgi:hypothetical protein